MLSLRRRGLFLFSALWCSDHLLSQHMVLLYDLIFPSYIQYFTLTDVDTREHMIQILQSINKHETGRQLLSQHQHQLEVTRIIHESSTLETTEKNELFESLLLIYNAPPLPPATPTYTTSTATTTATPPAATLQPLSSVETPQNEESNSSPVLLLAPPPLQAASSAP